VTDRDGRLAGVVTDGDLRRHMGSLRLGPGVEQLAVDAVMSRNARTVPPDTLVAEALELIESAKISVLIGVEDDRPVGLVHFLDLLRAGAA
jgi:arabinose-5-phosphate isomerase